MKYLSCVLGFMAMGFAGLPAFGDDAPAEESQNLFDTLDADDNGRLSSSEIPDEQARFYQRLLRVGDKDEDGELSRDEFRAATREREAPAAQPGDPQQRRGVGGLPIGRLFEQFDANDDGKLTLEEIPERARPQFERLFEGREEITREQLNALRDRPGQVAGNLRRLDRDGDGKVKLSDLPEFLRPRLEPVFERLGVEELEVARVAEALAQRPERGRPDAPEGRRMGRGPAFLGVLDGDRDGRLSREELAAAGEKFDELDLNGDGLIDTQELFGFPRDGARPDMQRPGQRPQRPERATDRPRRPERENGDSRPERPRREES